MSERLKITDDTAWMNGRLVFERPESRPSTVAQRNIVTTPEQREQLTESLVGSVLVRRQLTEADITAEIEELYALEAAEQTSASANAA